MLQITLDTSELQRTANKLFLLNDKNIRYLTARAMTRSAKSAQSALKNQMDRYIEGGPVPFTRNSTYTTFARPSNLTVEVGYRQSAPKGTAAGRYLNPMTVGGTRPPKSSERQLQRAGILRNNEYIIPADVYPLRLNKYGNLSGGTYTQVLSRLGALGEQGYTANVSGSATSQRKRSQRDFFFVSGEEISRTSQPLQRGIYARVGRRPTGKGGKGSPKGGRPATARLPRGFHTVFYVTGRPPTYRSTFPVPAILNQAYATSWAIELQRSYQEEMARAGFK